MAELLLRLSAYGLFLVPVGELEEWLGDYQVESSKSNKRAWANLAAQKILSEGKQSRDVWEFVSKIGNYLISRL